MADQEIIKQASNQPTPYTLYPISMTCIAHVKSPAGRHMRRWSAASPVSRPTPCTPPCQTGSSREGPRRRAHPRRSHSPSCQFPVALHQAHMHTHV